MKLGLVALLLVVVLVPGLALSGAPPEGQVTWVVALALAPAWFDPAEATGLLTPFITLYALHDALVKPMPGKPSVKRLVFKVVPDEVTRLAMLKRGEVDVAFAFRGALAEAVRRTPGLALKPAHSFGGQWVLFTEQWDPKSLWADRRVRLAVNHAIDRPSMNESLVLGFARMTGSIIPQGFEFSWPARESR